MRTTLQIKSFQWFSGPLTATAEPHRTRESVKICPFDVQLLNLRLLKKEENSYYFIHYFYHLGF